MCSKSFEQLKLHISNINCSSASQRFLSFGLNCRPRFKISAGATVNFRLLRLAAQFSQVAARPGWLAASFARSWLASTLLPSANLRSAIAFRISGCWRSASSRAAINSCAAWNSPVCLKIVRRFAFASVSLGLIERIFLVAARARLKLP